MEDLQPSTPPLTPPAAEVTDVARVTLPNEQPQAPPPPSDPYASYAELDYAGTMAETPVFGIDEPELRQIFGPAHVAAQRLGVEGFEDEHELGSRGEVLRGLASYQRHVDVLQSSVKRLQAQLPQGSTLSPAPPLAGEALERAISDLATTYFPNDHRLVMTSARAHLIKAAQEQHQLYSTLRALDQIHRELPARQERQRDAAALERARPAIAQMSEAEYDAEYGRVHQLFQHASVGGDLNGKARYRAELEKLARARWGG